MRYLFLVMVFFSIITSHNPVFSVVICSYNNERWVKINLSSIIMQTYDNYHIYYCDDASTDNTLQIVQEYIRENHLENKITLISNQERTYKMHNFYTIIHTYIPNDHIVVEIDGDDWFLSEDLFAYLADIYSKDDVWMTYGGYIAWPQLCKNLTPQEIPLTIILNNSFRSFYHKGAIFMALRTFYAGLFKKIKLSDLQEEGNFITRSSDVAAMIPMFEMAGERFYHITKQVYLYNTNTGNNDYQEDHKTQNRLYNSIRSKPKYKRLPEKNW